MKKNYYTFFKMILKPYVFSLICCFLLAIVFVGATTIITIVSGYALDLFLTTVDFTKLLHYLLILGICTVSCFLSEWLLRYISMQTSYKVVRDLRKKAIDKLLSVPVSYIDQHSHGDLISRVVGDVDIISDGLIQLFQKFFTGVLTIIVTLAIMFYLCYPLAIIVLVLTPLSLISSTVIAKKSSKIYKLQSEQRGKVGSFLNENMSNQKVIASYQNEDKVQADFEVINKELLNINFKAELAAAVINPSTRLINALIYAALALVGGIIVINGGFNLTSGLLVSFLLFANHYTKPFNEISSVIAELQSSFASIKRIQSLINEDRVIDDSNLKDFVYQESNIEINHIAFGYNKDKLVLKDIDIDIFPRHKVAIVGTTGCGKTTLINLIMRFYDPNGGNICVSNQDIATVKRSSLRDEIGMVLQDTWIFKGTIKDNIRYAKLDASDEEIIEASKKAKAHNFIMQMKDGYDTVVSDELGLSNGQKQLICIARLFLSEPNILILDEATSSIDTRTEVLVQEAFNEVMKGKTSIVIAHRLSTIRNADIILVLDKGYIVEQGNHEELLKKKGFYYELYNSQFKQI